LAITIQLNCPDHLKVIFDNLQYLSVKNDEGDYARDALLLWLTQADGIWISEEPFKARAALSNMFQLYPKLKFNTLFVTPDKLPYDYFERAVIEDTGGLEWTNEHVTEAVRVLEPCPEKKRVSHCDDIPFDERIALLHKIRTGREDKYEELDLVASICRQSFYHFVLEMWDELIAEPFIEATPAEMNRSFSTFPYEDLLEFFVIAHRNLTPAPRTSTPDLSSVPV